MIDFDRLNFDPGNMNKNFVLSLQLKEHPEISKIANFGGKIFQDTKNTLVSNLVGFADLSCT